MRTEGRMCLAHRSCLGQCPLRKRWNLGRLPVFVQGHPHLGEVVEIWASMESLTHDFITGPFGSARRYKTSSVVLLKHFRDVSLDKITPDEVERYKTARLNQ